MVDAGGARDVDAAVDRMDPGRAGIGDHDPGGAEDREAADDAEPAVGGAPRQALAAGIAIVTSRSPASPWSRAIVGDQLADQAARRRVDRRLADRDREPRPGHHADPLAGDEHHPGAGLAAAHRDPDQGAMGHVGVVAGVLDHAGEGAAAGAAALGEVEARLLAARQADRHRVGEAAGQQAEIGGLGRRPRRRPRWSSPGAARRVGLRPIARAAPEPCFIPAIGSGYSDRAMTRPIFIQAPGLGKHR